MGIVKLKDVIGWRDKEGAVFCPACGDQDGQAAQLVEQDFHNDDVAACDRCGARIW